MHSQVKESGLGDALKIRPITSNVELGKFLGKTVRYKPGLLTDEFLRKHGTVCRELFLIQEVQINYLGKECLRGYRYRGDFGRCINPDFIEVV